MKNSTVSAHADVKDNADRNIGECQNEILPSNSNTKTANSQRQAILSYLLVHGSINTLQARNTLFIMSPAARILELKARGHNIHTEMVQASFNGKRKIAQYVLLTGGNHE